ncbi:MAG: acyltransferase, partial [Ruminococcus sp.]|nr:acyltransferase [Ruminococcus sp.]
MHNLMMWAVPCFVMVTGALLLDPARNVTYTKLFRKYIPRMVIALLLFSVVFELLDTRLGGKKIGVRTFLDGIKNAVLGQSWRHMWYLYLMIALYLMMPFYRKVAASLEKKNTYYLLGVLFGISVAFAAAGNYDRAKHGVLHLRVQRLSPLPIFGLCRVTRTDHTAALGVSNPGACWYGDGRLPGGFGTRVLLCRDLAAQMYPMTETIFVKFLSYTKPCTTFFSLYENCYATIELIQKEEEKRAL